jgi:diacylglycerol kinase (ATP)
VSVTVIINPIAGGVGPRGAPRKAQLARSIIEAHGEPADAVPAEPRPLDVGEIEGRYFVNLAGIGFDAHIAARFASSSRRGFLGYIGITLRTLGSYVPLTYRITHDGATEERRAILVTIANSAQFGNGALIAPGARVDDGELDLVVVEEHSRVRTVCSLPRLFTGTIDRIDACRIARIRDVTIEAAQPLIFHVDGEPVQGGTRLHARVHPGALLVAVR